MTATEAPETLKGTSPAILIAALRAARKKIERLDLWAKDYMAFNAEGKPVQPHWPEAVRWSLDGALGGDVQTRLYLTRILGKPLFEFEHLPKTTHQDVLDLIDSAIARQERAHERASALAPAG